jgi:prephenate dehydrogenase
LPRIAIIGTGLIGTSLALALRQSQLRDLEIVGSDYDNSARAGAQKRGAFHRVEARLASAIDGADVVVLATPILAMQDLMKTLGPELQEGCVLTDVGSSKKVVMQWAEELLPRKVRFVGGHPMAGSEASGPQNASPTLFQGKAYCVVPTAYAAKDAVSTVTTLAEAVGAKPFFINVDEHDSFVAAVSHLPFLMSVALMETVSKSANWDDIAQLASSGFRDVSRLASGDAIMHRDISLSNREPIVSWIDSFIRELYGIRNMLSSEEEPDPATMGQVFEHAANERARWLAGVVSAASRLGGPATELPTFSESMSEMFLGRKGAEMQRSFFRGLRNGDRDSR